MRDEFCHNIGKSLEGLMNDQENQVAQGHDQATDIDADAVCAACECINEPGTLICRQCGTNLRDQRLLRLAELHEDETSGTKWNGRRIATALFSGVGLAILILVASPGGPLETMFTVQADTSALGEILWNGPRAGEFETMIAELTSNPPSMNDKNAAVDFPAAGATFDGQYAIVVQSSSLQQVIGVGAARQVGKGFYFCAIMDGNIEVRGLGTVDADGSISCDDVVTDRSGYRRVGVGFAQPSDDGSFTLIGAEQDQDVEFMAVAYRIHD
jgi:hypothetical protein